MKPNQENTCIRIFANKTQIDSCKQKLKEAQDIFISLAKVLSLAGNEVRLKILFLLDSEAELCPCDISDILKMSIPAISQHLRKLKDANLVSFRKEGQTFFYTLKPEHAKIIQPIIQNIKINQSTK